MSQCKAVLYLNHYCLVPANDHRLHSGLFQKLICTFVLFGKKIYLFEKG